nr:6752_t:CDS:2 [Entrophospora candida]CAG8616810.1 3616_t:CDS:2 [Entrophospora candida]
MNVDNHFLERIFTRIYIVFLIITTVFTILCIVFEFAKLATFSSNDVDYSETLEGLYITFTILLFFNVAIYNSNTADELDTTVYAYNCADPTQSDYICRVRSANLFFLFIELGYLIALSIIIYIVLIIRQKNGHPEEEIYLFQETDNDEITSGYEHV